ncbi:KAR9 (YPL269W) [Zygosaccharomyces parabailii]|nr:KAR9 (YPL269W) [Zygosaccharomyces parabailii]CDH11762.1 related to Karyogamy protein KAR9 [Zygosaccharomyces bailii ISA1307]
MDSGAKLGTQLVFKQQLPKLNDVLSSISSSTSLNPDHQDMLNWLSKELHTANEEIKWVLEVPTEIPQMLSFLDWLASEKETYHELMNTATLVQPSLSYLLDLIELGMIASKKICDFNDLLDVIEICTTLAAELKIQLNSKIPLLEASLEFEEISKDHISSLTTVIDKNIDLCFEIQEDRFASPIRHPPAFTLKQLIRLLGSQTDATEIKIPTFSPLEETLCRKYLKLKRSVTPIEKSLKEVLPVRIEHFSQRKIMHINYLTYLLQRKYQETHAKYKLMIKEISELKRELVDKRWNILFLNLNHELSSILDEIEVLQKKISEYNYNSEMQEKIKEQLINKSTTITKTFDVIYKALEFSLLNADIASKTNELAQKWLEVRPRSDRLLSSSSSLDESSMDSLSSKFRSLSVGSSDTSETEPSLVTAPSRGKFGALLLKKMNIKPVMVTSPTSSKGYNPFFHTAAESEKLIPQRLVLHPVPPLPFGQEEARKAEDQSDTPTVTKRKRHIEKLEQEKIKFYCKQPTQIPKLKPHGLYAAGWRTPKLDPPWTPFTENSGRLRIPTPLSDILLPKITG